MATLNEEISRRRTFAIISHPDAGKTTLTEKFLLQFFQKIEGIFCLAVHLIDKGKDGNMAHGTDLEELSGLGLDALGTVDDHDGAVCRHQSAVGIFGEVLVTGSIQNIDAEAVILELHNGRGNGNTSLLFDLHPVGHSGTAVLFALDSTCLCNGAAVEQEFLS